MGRTSGAQRGKHAPSRSLLRCATFGATWLLVAGCSKFSDTPGSSENDFGRTVNGISAVISGIVAQKIATNSNFHLTVQKPGWSDATVHGSTRSNSIISTVDLSLSSASFNANGEIGAMNGKVDKSEWDWKVTQTSPSRWNIGRALFKFDHTLDLTVENGTIRGELARTTSFNWSIKGSYTSNHVEMTISTGPFDPNFSISGTIQ